MSYKTISYGSSGEDVKKLQQTLNANGYSLTVDGKFGAKTQAAVKDYQRKNGLSVDGIVGKQTWGSLGSSATLNNKGNTQTQKGFSYKVTKPQYKKSESVISAENNLKQWENAKPEEYKSKYSEQIDEILNSILNREDFSYSMSSDPLYEQYRELYVNNAKKAMADTIGQGSALTGGYTNSYAQSVGNQTYNEYLTQLNEIALDLRDRAYEEYKDGGDKLIDDVTLLRSLDGDDYEKYLNKLQQYYDDGDYLLRKLSNMSDEEFELFSMELESWENDRSTAFKQYQDDLDREEFEKEMAFKKAEAQRDQANKDRSYALSVKKANSSSGSGSKVSSSEKEDEAYTVYPRTYKEFFDRTGVSTILTESEFNASQDYRSAFKNDYQAYLKKMYDELK